MRENWGGLTKANVAARCVEIDYTNWRGVRSKRKVLPLGFRFAATEHHPEEQWLMDAFCFDAGGDRTFALSGIHAREAASDAEVLRLAAERDECRGRVVELEALLREVRPEHPDWYCTETDKWDCATCNAPKVDERLEIQHEPDCWAARVDALLPGVIPALVARLEEEARARLAAQPPPPPVRRFVAVEAEELERLRRASWSR